DVFLLQSTLTFCFLPVCLPDIPSLYIGPALSQD
ncbi:MAG: hypothetical protein ACI90V_008347, partial [Bacillariaceae sp.]